MEILYYFAVMLKPFGVVIKLSHWKRSFLGGGPHSSVEMTILAQFALIDPDLCTLVPHLKVEVNGP